MFEISDCTEAVPGTACSVPTDRLPADRIFSRWDSFIAQVPAPADRVAGAASTAAMDPAPPTVSRKTVKMAEPNCVPDDVPKEIRELMLRNNELKKWAAVKQKLTDENRELEAEIAGTSAAHAQSSD